MSNRFHFNILCDDEVKKKDCNHTNGILYGKDFHCKYWQYVERFLPLKNNYEGIIKPENVASIISDIIRRMSDKGFVVRLRENEKEVFNAILSENKLIKNNEAYQIFLNEDGVSILSKVVDLAEETKGIDKECCLFQSNKFTVYPKEANEYIYVCDETSLTWCGAISIIKSEKDYSSYDIKKPDLKQEELDELQILSNLKSLLRGLKKDEILSFYLES